MKKVMEKMKKKYAVVEYSIAVLENYNPDIVFQSDSLEEVERYSKNFYKSAVQGYATIEREEGGFAYVETGEMFYLPSYV